MSKKHLSEEELKKLHDEAMTATAKWISNAYGERCGSYSPGCPSCEMWIRFDILFGDIDAEYTWMNELKQS